ncbi:MAG: hypothetical protein EB127_08990 [Alphaproteobacteria bacterium]|nr:hypothetical protein [Alphaproteobacteria bacterium]
MNIEISAPSFTKEKFAEMVKLFEAEFPFYQIEYKEDYTFWENIPNPDFGKSPREEEEIPIFKTAVCGCIFRLKKMFHNNFNISCFLHEDNIHIKPAGYYYSQFNASNLESLVKAYLMPDTFTFGNSLMYGKQTYKQWIDAHPDQKWSQHNYKIDQEDLAKIGIEV